MTEPRPLGRWLDTVTAANTPVGELVWLPPASGGLRAEVATVAGREFAVIRSVGVSDAQRRRQWNARIAGFVWFPEAIADKSAAGILGIKESPVGGFQTKRKAKAAVAEAHRLLSDHLRQQDA